MRCGQTLLRLTALSSLYTQCRSQTTGSRELGYGNSLTISIVNVSHCVGRVYRVITNRARVRRSETVNGVVVAATDGATGTIYDRYCL